MINSPQEVEQRIREAEERRGDVLNRLYLSAIRALEQELIGWIYVRHSAQYSLETIKTEITPALFRDLKPDSWRRANWLPISPLLFFLCKWQQLIKRKEELGSIEVDLLADSDEDFEFLAGALDGMTSNDARLEKIAAFSARANESVLGLIELMEDGITGRCHEDLLGVEPEGLLLCWDAADSFKAVPEIGITAPLLNWLSGSTGRGVLARLEVKIKLAGEQGQTSLEVNDGEILGWRGLQPGVRQMAIVFRSGEVSRRHPDS